MASHPPSQGCVFGVKHEGEATGKFVKVTEEFTGYLATPSPDRTHAGAAVLFLPDVFGMQYINNKLIADQFAANGYLTLIPDVFLGDPIPVERPPGFDMAKWRAEGSDGKHPHNVQVIDPIVVDSIKHLKTELGITKIGAVGYCFGAKYVVRHYKSGIDAGYVAHPSNVEESELAAITGPLSIAAAETDQAFPAERRHKSEDILQKTGNPYQINLYSGVVHGFAVRGDPNVKIQKYAKEQAFLQAVAWFDEHLL